MHFLNWLISLYVKSIAKGCYRKGLLSQKSAGHMQNRKNKTNTNPSPDPNRYRRRCPGPNARIQKFIHYMAIATFAIAALCDSGLSPLLLLQSDCLVDLYGPRKD